MVTRISGFASGMDIDSMVKGLMDAQRVPLDKLYQKKTYTEWQRDDYRTMNTALKEFDTLISDGIGRQSTFIQKTVSISNPDAVSIKNINSTTDFSGEIKGITLATAARMVSSGPNAAITSATQKLSDIDPTFVDQTITIKAINKDGGFDQVKKSDGTLIDKVYTLELKATDTLQSVIDKINAESGVTVFFDETQKQFSIIAKNTGDNTAGAEIFLGNSSTDGTVTGTSDFFTNILKVGTDNTAAGGTPGSNAQLTYNGLAITRASNTFRINGAEFTLKQNTLATDSVTFSSTADVDKIYDKVKEFVNSYNTLIANISDKISEKKDSDYTPLTSAQKKEMSEDEVKLWEERARKGTLRNDSSLRSLLTNMRNSLYTSVSGSTVDNLSNIGIKTTKDYLSGGKLEIDEAKLRDAIAANPNGIYELFMKDDGNSNSTAGDGLARRLRGNLDKAITDIGNKAGRTSSVNNTFTLGRLLNDYEDKISAFEKRMNGLETRYYKQFTAMEKAIQQANSQSTSLSSYFAN